MCTVCATAVPFVTSNPKSVQRLLNVAVRPPGGSLAGLVVGVAGDDGAAGELGGDVGDEDAGTADVDGLLLGSAEARPTPARQIPVAVARHATLRPARIIIGLIPPQHGAAT
jgi:hypothetical protein